MSLSDLDEPVARANERALDLLFTSDPVLIDVRPAVAVLPGMTRDTVLTSGPPLPWPEYTGGQREGIIGGVLYEGLASSREEAVRLLDRGEVRVGGCHDFGCVGSLAGITTASMPVLVVEDSASGGRGFCTLFEGAAPDRLNYGVYNAGVQRNLEFLAEVVGPLLSRVVRSAGSGIRLRPIMERALRQGDELHSRNAAASGLFLRAVLPALLDLDAAQARVLISYLGADDYFFLRPAMAASKVMADRMYGAEGSTIVTAMAFSCREFGIRVAGLGPRWFRGPLPEIETARLLPGRTRDDIEPMGGESLITEVCGLGAFAQAAAFPLESYQGGPDAMVRRNLEMYEITAGEHPAFKIPFLGYRGTPAGIDVARVAATGITPALDVGIAGRGGGQIGAGSFRAPLRPFTDAWAAFRSQAATPTPTS
ncbi:DUF1116 domain-containing protein [Actinomadura viridis]|uniref:YahG/YlbE-like protein n=1 Tax=Actinomadura viridis TaxID=58110 RepID=A0A931GN31_9ACTN|nr:DUF1116 domain-containing protein [Actinomadura viridis]MBG6093918.1 hypothetical protein [Actinomadura viridis]